MKHFMYAAAFAMLAGLLSPAAAQGQVSPAELTMISDGVFEMSAGSSTNLTDRPILLAFTGINRKGRACLVLAGTDGCFTLGSQLDLKSYSSIRGLVEDTERCILDVAEITQAQGVPDRVKLRFYCR